MWTYQCQNLCNMVSASLACAALTLTDSSPHSMPHPHPRKHAPPPPFPPSLLHNITPFSVRISAALYHHLVDATRKHRANGASCHWHVNATLICLAAPPPSGARAARGCLIGGVMAASCMARLASAGATMCVERKWLKALCAREPQAMASISAGGKRCCHSAHVCTEHAGTGALPRGTKQATALPEWPPLPPPPPPRPAGLPAFRRIDLVCLFAAPILTGTLMTFASQRGAALALAAWNAATWGPQVLLLRWAAALGGMSPAAQGLLPPEPEPAPPQLALSPSRTTRPAALLRECRRQLRVFWGQSMALAILPLAMLYFSVLSLGLLMTSYLK